MRRLIYCVLSSTNSERKETIVGINSQPVRFLKFSSLSAAVSSFDDSQKSFDINSMITYHRVIESLFREGAIIPFRFKTLLDSEEEVESLLKEKEDSYKDLLSTLDGVAEMGIRLVKEKPVRSDGSHNNHKSEIPQDVPNPGTSFLKSRRAFYSVAAWSKDQQNEFGDLCARQFQGLFVNFKSEVSPLPEVQNRKGLTMISLYFLVRKDLVHKFRSRFQELKPIISDKIMLSGPWPPYNFVV
jgi:hypothetical protein